MALSLNKVLIIGNCTRDPEMRTIPSGQSVATFGIATNRRWKDQQSGEWKEQAEFHNIVAWARLAETCGQYLKKGSRVYIEGRLQTRTWEDQTGVKKSRTEVVAEQMIMLDRPGATAAMPAAAAAVPNATPQDTAAQPAPQQEEEINVEDIPF